MRKLIIKYQSFILYCMFGLLTTLINICIYIILYEYIHIANILSNIIAWFFSVTFAFVTNKIYVFKSKLLNLKNVFKEFFRFLIARIATGGVDLIIMYIGVDILKRSTLIIKIGSNILVIILNYILSRLIVFKSR